MDVNYNANGTVKVSGLCRVTGQYYEVNNIPGEAFHLWQRGTLIQKALPMLDADQREFLISGTSPEGWEILFPKEEEEV
jgi:hypothetical protein